jgi:hypothetical protein
MTTTDLQTETQGLIERAEQSELAWPANEVFFNAMAGALLFN